MSGTIGSMPSPVLSPIPALRDVSQSADWEDVGLSRPADARDWLGEPTQGLPVTRRRAAYIEGVRGVGSAGEPRR